MLSSGAGARLEAAARRPGSLTSIPTGQPAPRTHEEHDFASEETAGRGRNGGPKVRRR
jgi:hypothetical protein